MKTLYKLFIIILVIVFLSTTFSACSTNNTKTDQEKISRIVQDQFNDIDQMRNGRSLSLDEAEACLYCWADTSSGMEISEEELREAIWVVLESNDQIRDLINSIDEIDLDDY